MNESPIWKRFLIGLACGAAVAYAFLIPKAQALDCAEREAVRLDFESASLAHDEEFWRREFSAPEAPEHYDSRKLTNNSLSSHNGWWRLKHKRDQ